MFNDSDSIEFGDDSFEYDDKTTYILPNRDAYFQSKLQRTYNCIMAQALSLDHRFLIAGNYRGDIFVINVQGLQAGEPPDDNIKLYSCGRQSEINSLCFHENTLIVGTLGSVFGLKWLPEAGELGKDHLWEIKIPLEDKSIGLTEVNSLWLRPKSNLLYAGCGDNYVYEINLETITIVRDYRGHDDYIHQVCGYGTNNLATASEDGTIRLWSSEQAAAITVLEPYKIPDLLRSDMGKWQGAVAVDGYWLLCAGGVKPSLWHLQTNTYTSTYPFPGKVHVCDFIEDMLFLAGEHSNAHFYAMNGQIKADIKTDNTAIYSAVWQLQPQRLMSIGGYSNWLSLVNDFNYLDSTIELYQLRKTDPPKAATKKKAYSTFRNHHQTN